MNSSTSVGFTGTRQGLTLKQRDALREVLQRLLPVEVHHGNAIGADSEFSAMLHDLSSLQCEVVHPCLLSHQQAVLSWHPDTYQRTVLQAKAPLDRNRDIVNACELLIACPASVQEKQRSGTWATVRYARQGGKTILVVHHDGTLQVE